MLAVLFAALLSSQTGVDGTALDRFAGRWKHAGGDGDQRAVEAAIERVVAEMSWIARDIARSRLRATNEIPKTLEIVRSGDRVRIAFDGREREAALQMPPITIVGVTGDELAYTLNLSSGALVQRFEGSRGGRLNTIRMEGDAIVVRVTIFSNSLPANVVYDLRYVQEK